MTGPVDISVLRESLKATAAGDRLVINAATVNHRGVLALVAAVTGQPSLTLSNATIGPLLPASPAAPAAFQIDATVAILDLASAPAKVSFSTTSVGLLMVLRIANLPVNWSLADMFPSLTQGSPTGSTALYQPFMGDLVADPVLILASADFIDPDHGELFWGINLVGTAIPPAQAGVLTGTVSRGPIKGFLEIDPASFANGPLRPAIIDLALPIDAQWSLPAPFDAITLRVSQLQLGAMSNAIRVASNRGPSLFGAPQTSQWASIDGSLTCGKLEISASILLPSSPDAPIVLNALLAGATLSAALSEIAQLVGWPDLPSSLPEPLKTLTDVAVKALSIGYAPESKAITFFSVLLDLEETWTVLPENLLGSSAPITLGDLQVAIRVNNPMGKDGAADRKVLVSGRASYCGATVQAFAEFPNFSVAVCLLEGTISLNTLLAQIFPTASLPDLDISTLDLSIADSSPEGKSAALLLGFSDSWSIHTPALSPLVLSDLMVGVTHDAAGGTSGQFSASLAIAGARLALQSALPDLALQAALPPIRIGAVATELAGSLLPIPRALDATISGGNLFISKSPAGFELRVSGQTPALDSFAINVANTTATGWNGAIGFSLSASAHPSMLGVALSPFDALGLTELAAVIASADDPAFSFGNALVLPAMRAGVTKGLTLYANLALSGDAGLSAAGKLLGVASLAVEIEVNDSPTLVAQETSSVSVPGASNLALGNAGLRIGMDPLSVGIDGVLAIPIQSQTLTATGALAITPTGFSFALDAKLPAPSLGAPVGFKGVSLEEIGVSLSVDDAPPAVNLSLEGSFRLGNSTGDDKFAFAFAAVGGEVWPSLLSCRFQALGLPEIFGACMDSSAPLAPGLGAISITDLYVYWCDRAQLLPDGSSAIPGFGFNGTLNFFGWQAMASLQAFFASGLKGTAAMAPLTLGAGTLSVTGAGGKDGPYVTVDTAGPQYFGLSMDAKLFDIVGTNVSGEIADTGMTFTIQNQGGILDDALSISIAAAPPAASFTSKVSCDIDVQVGPIQVPDSTLSLGTLHVNAGFSGSLDAKMSQTSFQAEVSGGFEWQNQSFNVLQFAITEPWSSVADLKARIETQIVQEAQSIFASIVSNAEGYFRAVKNGLVTGASNFLELATQAFSMSASDALHLMQQLGLKITGDSTAWFRSFIGELKSSGWTFQQILSAAQWAGVGPAALVPTLYQFFRNEPHTITDITRALSPGNTPTEIATILKDVGAPLADVADALKQVFPGVANVAEDVWGDVENAGSTVVHAVTTAGKTVLNGLKDAGRSVLHWFSHW